MNTPITGLALSEAPQVEWGSAPTVAERLADLLELRDRALNAGLTAQAEAYTDRIIDETWAPA